MTAALTGTGRMVRLVLRRDRIRLPVWVLAVVALLLSSVFSVASLYTTPSDRQVYASAVGGNPVAIVMGGPGHGLPSLGGIVVFEIAVTGYVAVALMSLLLVVRHTRAEEEAGRAELLRAGAVGRYAGLVAAVAVVSGANVLVATGVGAGMVAAGLPLPGSLALAASFAVFGCVFAAVAAVVAQVTEHARGASGMAAAVLGVVFVLRAAGDVGNGALSWASPMGWALAVRPFAGERWAVLLLPAVLFVVLLATAFALVDRRDLGAGLTAARPGRAAASRWLSGAGGLAWRQHRAALAGWSVGLFALGVSYGSVGEAVEDLVSQNEALAALVATSGTSLVDSFFALAASIVAVIASGFALQAATRMHSEEAAGRLEPLLATALPRWRWATAHLLIAALGSAVLLGLAGLGLGVAHGALTGDASQIPRLTAATLVYAPATWMLVGLAAALFGLLPRAAAAVWAVLAGCAFVLLLGETLRLPDWVLRLSPFDHVPPLPAASLDAAPLLALAAGAAAAVALGLLALRRRDVG